MTSKPINVGIIGVHPQKGWAAQAHMPALAQLTDYQVAAVSHHDGEIAQAAADMFGAERAFASAEDMIADPRVELVVVAVKVTRHRELVTKALKAGKAVFCEWPLGTNLAEAIDMRDLARVRGLKTAIGLQARAAPTFSYARDLIADGYLGEVTSATMIGSGIVWGDTMPEGFAYTLDPSAGASMLHVPFAHSIDAMLHALNAKIITVSGHLDNRRTTTRIQETGAIVPMKAADQITVRGKLSNEAILSVHFRGGLARATNFHLELNGSKGDLVITSPVGYVGLGGFTLKGAQNDELLHDLEIPTSYNLHALDDGVHQSVAAGYVRLASDLRAGTSLSPSFDDAVELHKLVSAIERSEGRTVNV